MLHSDLRVDPPQSRRDGTEITQVEDLRPFQGVTKRNGVLVQPAFQWNGVTKISAAAEQVGGSGAFSAQQERTCSLLVIPPSIDTLTPTPRRVMRDNYLVSMPSCGKSREAIRSPSRAHHVHRNIDLSHDTERFLSRSPLRGWCVLLICYPCIH